jgi:hypothetical protein
MVLGLAPFLITSALALGWHSPVQTLGVPDCPETLSLERLSQLSWEELDCLYRRAQPGRPPCGVVEGRAIYDKARKLSAFRSAGTNALWLGKDFHPEQGMLINRWKFGKAIKAEVYPGVSLIDGGPALVADYRQSSFIWRNVRDEIREVAPGLYLGVMFKFEKSEGRFSTFFALAECAHGQ